MGDGPAWSDLAHKGYLLVPSFVSEHELQMLDEDYQAGPAASDFELGYKPIGAEALGPISDKVRALLPRIRSEAGLEIDVVLNGLYFATRFAKLTSAWHQDADAYYEHTHDHVNYLNFYMPMLKPERGRSNVSLIPLDALRARAVQVHDALWNGGSTFLTVRGRTLVLDNPTRKTRLSFDLDFDFEVLGTTPPLERGDLLVLRGDVPHRSQDLRTTRVSASIRAGCSKYGFVPPPRPAAPR